MSANAATSPIESLPSNDPVPHEPLSKLLWGIDWHDHLPYTVTRDGIRVVPSTFDQALPFIQDNYETIFEQDDEATPFAAARLGGRKARYYHVAGDFFELKDGPKTVGLLINTPVDWGTYYIRSAAALPDYQGRKIIQRFFPYLFEVLARAGVERIEADTSPSNMATMHLLTRLRFNVTGTTLSERWGALVHFTRFLDDDSESVFLRQFCAGVKYQRRGPPASPLG